MSTHVTLSSHLAKRLSSDLPLRDALEAIASACTEIAGLVSRGALTGILGSARTGNVQGEDQKQLDVIANEVLIRRARESGRFAAVASEEMEKSIPFVEAHEASFLLLFDPLDGSSNLDVNLSVGTIFSILRAPESTATLTDAHFLQAGRRQLAAGYCLYGPQTTLVLAFGDEDVRMFCLDGEAWHSVGAALRVPVTTEEFAVNISNRNAWDEPVRRYIDDCIAGADGPRGKRFNMRWTGSMVADIHRILTRGGIFLYPPGVGSGGKPAGKLRLMYEINPMSFLIERAGGRAVDGEVAVLETVPQQLHQRVGIALGSYDEVLAFTNYMFLHNAE